MIEGKVMIGKREWKCSGIPVDRLTGDEVAEPLDEATRAQKARERKDRFVAPFGYKRITEQTPTN